MRVRCVFENEEILILFVCKQQQRWRYKTQIKWGVVVVIIIVSRVLCEQHHAPHLTSSSVLPLFNLSWQLNTNSSTKRSSKLWPHISHRQNHRSAQFLSNANPSAFPCASGMNHDFAHFCSLRGYMKNDFECNCQHKQQEKEREKKIKTVVLWRKKAF